MFNRASKKIFPDAIRTSEQQILMALDSIALREASHYNLLDIAAMAANNLCKIDLQFKVRLSYQLILLEVPS